MTAMAECTMPGQMLDQSSSIHKSKEQLKEPAEIHSGLLRCAASEIGSAPPTRHLKERQQSQPYHHPPKLIEQRSYPEPKRS